MPIGIGPSQLAHLRSGEHGFDALDRRSQARVDADDASVRDVTTFERQVLQPGDLHIVDVRGAALYQARILTPFDPLADELR